jgi:hypothetical protein
MDQQNTVGFRVGALVNFCGSTLLQFAWLAYACAAGQDVQHRFLLFQSSVQSSAWSCVLIGPAVLLGYFLSNPKFNLAARILAAVVGGGGLLLLPVRYALAGAYGDPPLSLSIETVIGVYVLLSYAALAALWRRCG